MLETTERVQAQPVVYSYVRMSAKRQLAGDSLRRQVELAEAWCVRHGYALDNSIHDLGFSAFDSSNVLNGSLGVFLEKVRRGEIITGSILLVESLDRLSRDHVLDALEIFNTIVRAGIRLVTLADEREYSRATIKKNWSELIISLAIMSRAHEESQQKAMRLREAWAEKRNVMTEKKLTARCPAWLTLLPARNSFTTQGKERRVQMIRAIFTDYIGGMGKGLIAQRLNKAYVKALEANEPKEVLDDLKKLGPWPRMAQRHRSKDSLQSSGYGSLPIVGNREGGRRG